jgi:hypothetical protein
MTPFQVRVPRYLARDMIEIRERGRPDDAPIFRELRARYQPGAKVGPMLTVANARDLSDLSDDCDNYFSFGPAEDYAADRRAALLLLKRLKEAQP